MAKSPAVILFDVAGNPMAVEDGVAIPVNTTALLAAGSDGTDARFLLVDAAGSPVVVGSGISGTPAGGVLTVQGTVGGTAIPISGTVSATNPSVSTNNAAAPGSSTQVGGTDGTNLQSIRVFDADTGGGTQYVLGTVLRKSASGGSVEAGTSADPFRVDPTGTTTQPISAASLPLPTGAATETTLGTRLADATFTGRINTLGQKTSANSTPVVLSSDQSAIPITDNAGSLTVDSAQLPAALVGARLDVNNGAWLGSTAPTVGQKTMTNSVPVVISSDQTTFPVTATFSASDTIATATFDSAGDTVTVSMTGQSAAGFQLLSGMLGSVVPEVSFDGGTTWIGCTWSDPTTGIKSTGHTFTFFSSDLSRVILGVGGASHVRVRASSVSSGSSSVSLRSTSSLDSSLRSESQSGGSSPSVATQVGGVDGSTLRAMKVGSDGTLATNVAQWVGSTAPTVGQKVAANSLPVVLASDVSIAFGAPDPGNTTSTPLGAGASWTGAWTSVTGVNSISSRVRSNVDSDASGLRIQWALDGSGTDSWSDLDQTSGTFFGGTSPKHYQFNTRAPFYRLSYTNGAVPQSSFTVATVLKGVSPNSTVLEGQSASVEPARPSAVAGYDGANNVYRVLRTGIDGNLSVNRTVSANLVSTASCTLNNNGLGAVSVQISGVWSATVVFEGTIDGTNYFSVPGSPMSTEISVPVFSTTSNGQWAIKASGLSSVRARVSAYTSGTVAITIVGTPAAVRDSGFSALSSPNALSLGMIGQVTSYGTLKVTTEGSELFVDPFDGGTVDVTNRWNSTIVSGGVISQAAGILNIATSTVASRAGALTSQNLFRALGLGFQIFGASVQLESAAVTNNHRFWGLGTQPGGWTATTPIQDGVGFEQDITGALLAVTYNGGTRTIVSTLTRPSDGLNHRYAMYIRADLVFWYFDTLEVPITSAGWPPLGQQTLPIRLHSINHTTPPGSAPTFNVVGVGMTETSHSGVQISDGTFAWRKATIDTAGRIQAGTTAITPAQTSVAGSASSVQLLAANSARKGATIFNDSTAILFLKLGTTASNTSFTARMVANAYYEVPYGYLGRLDGIWASATGNARITELT